MARAQEYTSNGDNGDRDEVRASAFGKEGRGAPGHRERRTNSEMDNPTITSSDEEYPMPDFLRMARRGSKKKRSASQTKEKGRATSGEKRSGAVSTSESDSDSTKPTDSDVGSNSALTKAKRETAISLAKGVKKSKNAGTSGKTYLPAFIRKHKAAQPPFRSQSTTARKSLRTNVVIQVSMIRWQK